MPFRQRVLAGMLVACAVRSANGQAAREGWTIGMRTSNDTGGGTTQATTMRIQTSGQRIRVEMLNGAAALSGGMYMLAAVGDSTMIAVTPAQRIAMTMGPGGFGRDAMPRIEVADVKIDRMEQLGPGETLLGRATTRYRITQSSTMKISLANDTCARHVTSTVEMWVAPDVDLGDVMVDVARALGRGNNSVNALLSVRSERMPKGTALRSITSTLGLAPGTTRRTSTTEFVELTRTAIDTSVFVVPADYQRLDQATIMASLPSGTMSAGMRDIGLKTMRAMCGQGKSP